jgi:hypothetical protein
MAQMVSQSMSQMSPDLVPPFLPLKRIKREVYAMPGSQVADL